MIVLIPFVAVWGLLMVARAVEHRRDARVGRHITLTDAIHRELSAAAALGAQSGICRRHGETPQVMTVP